MALASKTTGGRLHTRALRTAAWHGVLSSRGRALRHARSCGMHTGNASHTCHTHLCLRRTKPNRAFAACKPIVAYTKGPSPGDLLPGQALLFGNENIYVFFR